MLLLGFLLVKFRSRAEAFWSSVFNTTMPELVPQPQAPSAFCKGPMLLCIIALWGLPRQRLQNLLSSFVSPPVRTLNQICSPPGSQDFQNFTCLSFIHPSHTLYFSIFFVPGIVLGFRDRYRVQQSRHGPSLPGILRQITVQS